MLVGITVKPFMRGTTAEPPETTGR